ncbi:P60-like protein [Scleroderma citrinum]
MTTTKQKTSSRDAKKPARSALGAPTQLAQSSRKGKRAWRKNIDMQDVEEGMESLRTEERVIGSTLQKQTDDQLFVIDTKGDEELRKSLPRFSKDQLTSSKIISQRSAIPAVASRTTKVSKDKLTSADKDRLLRIAKKPRKGPFNAIMDPTEFGAGSARIDVTHAVKNSGTHDLWAPTVEEVLPHGLEATQKRSIKKPEISHPRDIIDVPAVLVPPQGASYNPAVQAHGELLLEAYQVEKRKQDEADRLAEYRKQIDQARQTSFGDVADDVPPGMIVDEIQEDADEPIPTDEAVVPRRPLARKTKQQRTRMLKQKAEKQALAEKALRKRILHSITSAKSMKSELDKTLKAQEQARLARQLSMRLRLRKGLAGRRLGKHKVPESHIDVQVGEDLCENLRTLKPEGNLFRDRFVSLQQRALIEPRAPVLPTKRRAKPVLYEKHTYKRFN